MNIQRPRYLKIATKTDVEKYGQMAYSIYTGDPLTGYKFNNSPKHFSLVNQYTWGQIQDMMRMTKHYSVLLMMEEEYFVECL